jgi:hypothetical protein
MKKCLGYILFIVSFLLWGVIAALPFFPLSLANIAILTTVILVISESLFAISLWILGKAFWVKVKQRFGWGKGE